MTYAPAPPSGIPSRDEVLRPVPSRRAIARVLLLLAAGIALTAGLVLVNRLFDPAHVSARYFGALADRDADGALDLLDPDTAPTGALMNSAVLRDSGYTPPQGVHVDSVRLDDHGSSALARVSYRLDGDTAVADLPLVRSGHRFLLFERWRIRGGAFQVQVQAPAVDRVQVAGVPVAAGAPVAAFPGTYRAGLPDNPLLTADPQPVVAGPDAAPLQLQPTIKSTAYATVGKQIKTYLDTCALSTQVDPPDCPLQDGTESDIANVHWTILSYPHSTLQVADGQVVLTTTERGEARISGDVPGFDGGLIPQSDTVDYEVSGPVVVENGAVKWHPGQ